MYILKKKEKTMNKLVSFFISVIIFITCIDFLGIINVSEYKFYLALILLLLGILKINIETKDSAMK